MSIAFPIGMGVLTDIRGLLQRLMFVISFVFVIREFRGRPGPVR